MSKYDLPEEAKDKVEQIAREMLNQKVTEALIREERKEERQKHIRIFVKRSRKMNFSDEVILESIMEDYDLSEEDAREYLEESKSENNVS